MSRGTGRSHPRYTEYAKMVGARLRKELKAAGISAYTFAPRVGVHRGILSHYMAAHYLPSPAMLVLMARTLGIPVSRLLPHRVPKRRKPKE